MLDVSQAMPQFQPLRVGADTMFLSLGRSQNIARVLKGADGPFREFPGPLCECVRGGLDASKLLLKYFKAL